MHFLHEGWKQTWHGIQQHRGLVLIIVVVQICLVAATGFTALTYQAKILQNAQNIIEPLQNANYNADNINAGQPFLEDLQNVYANYQALINNLISLLMWLSIIFLMNGLLWVLSHCVLGMKRIISLLHAWAKYIVASVLLLGAFSILSYYVLRGFLTFESEPAIITSTVKQLLYVLLAVYYLLLVAFAFINISSWKEWIAAAFRTGILRIHKIVVVLLINWVILGGNIYLIYYAAMNNLHIVLILLLGLTLLVLLVFTRLFWIACLQQIAHPQLEEKE